MARAERRPTLKKQIVFTPTPMTLEEDRKQLRQAPSPEEIARRSKAVKAMLKLRDELPFVDTPITEILRQAREEDDRKLNG